MDKKSTCNFKLMSFNVRGLNDQKKRTSVFNFIARKQIDICFIQESHSSLAEEQSWVNQWGGKIIFCHGARNSRGVLILVRKGLDFIITDFAKDDQGRNLEINCMIQGSPFKLINVYAPNTEMSRLNFLKNLKQQIKRENVDDFRDNIILGGDFNLIQNPRLDRKGGSFNFSATYKKGQEVFEDIINETNLVDIWRIKNPEVKRFTWRRKNPLVSSRLDFWCLSQNLCDYVESLDILPSIKSDHSPIVISIKTYENKKGPGLWKINNSFLDEEEYVKSIQETMKLMVDVRDNFEDKRLWWEYLKFKLREVSMKYGKVRAKKRRDLENIYEDKLKLVEEKLDSLNDNDNHVKEELENEKGTIMADLEEIDEYKTEGLIMRSRVECYEKGEKKHKILFKAM